MIPSDLTIFIQEPGCPNGGAYSLAGLKPKGPTGKMNSLSHAGKTQSFLVTLQRKNRIHIKSLTVVWAFSARFMRFLGSCSKYTGVLG